MQEHQFNKHTDITDEFISGDNWDANHMQHARAQSMLAIHCLSRLPLSGPSTVRSSQQLSPVRHHGRASFHNTDHCQVFAQAAAPCPRTTPTELSTALPSPASGQQDCASPRDQWPHCTGRGQRESMDGRRAPYPLPLSAPHPRQRTCPPASSSTQAGCCLAPRSDRGRDHCCLSEWAPSRRLLSQTSNRLSIRATRILRRFRVVAKGLQ